MCQETHIIHKFDEDFYGSWLRVVVCGYIRPERNYKSLGDNISESNDRLRGHVATFKYLPCRGPDRSD